MSCSIGVNLLPFNGGVDFSEVKTYAMEITRKASLEQLGYDITDPDNPEKDYQGFHIIDDALCWNDFSGCVKHPDITAIVDQIVNRFPDVEFVYRWFQEGSMAEEQYIKGDVREELVSWFLDIGIDNPEALRKVRKKMPDVKQSGPFLLFPFAHHPVSKIRQSIDEALHKVVEIIPGTPLFCVICEDEDQCIVFTEKGVYSDGRITWKELTDDESNVIMRRLEIWDNKPTETLFEFLFKGLEIEIGESKNETPVLDEDEEDSLPR